MLPLLPLVGTAFNVVHGLVQQAQAKKGLNSLVKPQGYNVTPEQQQSYDRAQKDAMSGYSAQERAAYLSNLASRNNAGYSRALKFGGNGLAGAIQAGVNYGNSKALNDFAANDAQLRRSNIRYADSRGDVISGQRNRNTQLQNQEYNQAAQAYGGAIKAGKENVFNSLNLFSALNPMALGGIGGGGNRMAGGAASAQMPDEIPDAGMGDGADAGYVESQGFNPSAVPGLGASAPIGTNWSGGNAWGAPNPDYGMNRFPPYQRTR